MKARSSFSDSDWDELWDVLEALHVLNGKICWENPDDIYDTTMKVFPLQRYLDKVVAVLRDVKIMLNAANSPQLRQYFVKDFTITTVDPIGPFSFPLPKSEDDWQAVFQIALQELNKARTEQGEEEFEAVATKIKADAQRLANRTMSATNYVHCECILLSYMLAHGSEQYISYIGVSKLCCQGCFHLINTANSIYGTRIITKGCHHKWYYPWRIPEFPAAKELALVKCFYAKIAWIFGHTYSGFRSKTQGVLSASEASDLSEDDDEPPELDPEDVAQKFILKTSLEAESRLSGAVTH